MSGLANSRHGAEDIANAAHRTNERGTVGAAGQLLAQPRHQRIDRAIEICPLAPAQRAKQRVARQGLPRLADKGQQEIELGRRQVDRRPAGLTRSRAVSSSVQPAKTARRISTSRPRMAFSIAEGSRSASSRMSIRIMRPQLCQCRRRAANHQIRANRDITRFIVNNLPYVTRFAILPGSNARVDGYNREFIDWLIMIIFSIVL